MDECEPLPHVVRDGEVLGPVQAAAPQGRTAMHPRLSSAMQLPLSTSVVASLDT